MGDNYECNKAVMNGKLRMFGHEIEAKLFASHNPQPEDVECASGLVIKVERFR